MISKSIYVHILLCRFTDGLNRVSDTFFPQRFATSSSRFCVCSLEYSYVISGSNIHFRTEIYSYPKNVPTVFFKKIGVSEA